MNKILVIGAGPAGLTAAYQLAKYADVKPLVLETSPYLGGISRTHEYHGNRMDLGGHRFFTKSKEVMALWLELMPLQGAPARDDKLLFRTVALVDHGPDPERNDDVMLRRRRVSRIYFLRKFFDYPISLQWKTFANMGLARTMYAGFGYLLSAVKKRKEDSLEDFYINRFGKPLYAMFFEDYTEKVWGVHPSQIAPDWGSQRVKGLSLAKAVLHVIAKPFVSSGAVETSLIEEFYYPKKGPGQIYEKMADQIRKMGGTILTDTEVEQVKVVDGKVVSVAARNRAGERMEFETDTVFSSMAVKDLIQAMGEVPAKEVREIAAALPYRDYITVGLLVKRLKISNESGIQTVGDIVPDCWIYVQERNVKLGRLQIFNNWSPYLIQDPDTVWLGLEYFCNEGDELWNMPRDQFIAFAAGELEQIGIIDQKDVIDTEYVRVKKAYPAYFGAYAKFGRVREYLKSIENLYCIGRNGQHRYNNMDHSMLTAIYAVDAFRKGGEGKDTIWDVNTEEDYHETSSAGKDESDRVLSQSGEPVV